MSWETFKKYFVYLHPLKLSLDTSKVFFKDNFLHSMQSKIVRAFNEMEALEAGHLSNPDEKRMVGHYWLRNFQLAPKQAINIILHDNWLKVRAFADKIIPFTKYDRQSLKAIKDILRILKVKEQSRVEISEYTPYPQFLHYVDELQKYTIVCREKGFTQAITQFRQQKDEFEIEIIKNANVTQAHILISYPLVNTF